MAHLFEAYFFREEKIWKLFGWNQNGGRVDCVLLPWRWKKSRHAMQPQALVSREGRVERMCQGEYFRKSAIFNSNFYLNTELKIGKIF